MKKIIPIALVIFVFATACFAAEFREIMLKDGSVITGEITSFDGSHYTIKSNSLGTVTIASAQILAIQTPARINSAAPQPKILQNDLNSVQKQMLKNKEVMGLIESMQHDPQVQAIVNDPKIMQAIAAGDFQTLLNNPKFKALMNHPTVNQIKDKVLQ